MEKINKKLLNWASILEPGAREQAERAASMPFVFPHLALMPDAHLGRGATVGSVIPTDRAIIPAAVGVDIGCGMAAVRTQFTREQLTERGSLAPLREAIEHAVPLSAGRYNTAVAATAAPRIAALTALAEEAGFDPAHDAGNWALQLGTLGGGNHFIEVTVDELDRVWLFLHSGSRGIGNRIAMRHIAVARAAMEQWWITLPDPDLAYLVEDTDEFWTYIRELRWAQHFALLNREEMMDRVVAATGAFVGTTVDEQERVNCLAGETLVTTRYGPAPIEELAGATHELLTSDGVWVKAPVRSFGHQVVSAVRLSRSGVIKTIRATASHRWLLRTRRGHQRETSTDELKAGDRLQFTFPRRLPELRPDSEAVARGFVFGDGSARGKFKSYAAFCGAKDAALLPLFEKLGLPPRTYGPVTRVHGLPGSWKRERPRLDEPPDVLYGWLAGYFAADGDVDKTGRPTLSSASRENLEYVRLLCQTIGIGTFGVRTRVRLGLGSTPSELHLVGLMRGDLDADFFFIPRHRARFESGWAKAERRGWNVVSVTPSSDTTKVYCATVDETHAFALSDNILTGNCHHNYTAQETHWGRTVWVSRKGAIDASAGTPGLIPGSMGTASYVVTGKGNAPSLHSSPHGAGRTHSRAKARRTFTHEQLREAMAGIEFRDSAEFLDEIPAAYKEIDVVMADAADLVEVRHTLRQVVNVKGA